MIDRMRIRWEEKKKRLLLYLKENPITSKTIVSSLSIQAKHAGYFAMLPENLDLEAHIQRYPLTCYKFIDLGGHIMSIPPTGATFGSYFDKERMIHLLGLITSARADNRDAIDESDFVPIHSRRIRKYFKDYLSYLDYLIMTGIVDCDRQYFVGERPRRYKLSLRFKSAPLIPYYYSYFNPSDVNSIEEDVYNERTNSFYRNTLLEMPYLSHWYNQKKLELNPLAEIYAFDSMRIKQSLGCSHWDISDVWDAAYRGYKRKNPRAQYDAIIQNINEVKIHHYKAKIDANVHRLHSVLTYMQSEYRNFLTYDGQQLVCIDIKNSQPYLLNLLLNREFWDENSTLPISINNLPLNIQELFTSPSELLPTIRGFFESLNEENYREFQEYIPLAASGHLYEAIVTRALQIKTYQIDRKKAKKNLLILFYSPNREEGSSRRTYIVEKVFCEKFPTIMGLIRLIKSNYNGTEARNNHSRFACLLQSIESEIVLHRCCRRIWEEANHQVPIFTIHDSIVTTSEHADYLRDVMMQELTVCIGVPPTLEPEVWSLSNPDLDQNIFAGAQVQHS